MSIARQVCAGTACAAQICASHCRLAERWRRPCRRDAGGAQRRSRARFPQVCRHGRGCTRSSSSCGVRPPSDRSTLSTPDPKNAAERNLEAITPASSPEFLLRAVEGSRSLKSRPCSTCRPRRSPRPHSQAGREIAQQVATDILIIEDEPIIALDIEALVRELGHGVTGIARTHKEALASARAQPPGLVLADIHLADGSSGLAAVNEILSIDQRACHLHHRLSGAFADRRKTGARVPDHQAVQGRHGAGDHQPGAVLRSPGRPSRRNRRRWSPLTLLSGKVGAWTYRNWRALTAGRLRCHFERFARRSAPFAPLARRPERPRVETVAGQ